MRKRTPVSSALVAGALLLGGPAGLRSQETTVVNVDLSGVWTLNRELSDKVGSPGGGGVGQGAVGGRRGGPGGGGGMGGPGGGTGGRMGDRPRGKSEDIARTQELMRELMDPPLTLTLTQKETEVVFTDADGRVRRYTTDGKKEKHQAVAGTVETETEWKTGALVLKTFVADGVTIVQTYGLDEGKTLLVVTRRAEGSRFGREAPGRRAVYDKSGGPGA